MSDPLDLEAIEKRAEAHAALGIWVAPRSAQSDRRALLAEVRRLRADREKAREALGKAFECFHALCDFDVFPTDGGAESVTADHLGERLAWARAALAGSPGGCGA